MAPTGTRGTTLVALLDMYRAESRMSLNPAHNTDARQKQVKHIQRVQEWLWADNAWPLLRVDRFLKVQAGQRYYSMPGDIDIDRITKAEIRHDQVYCPLQPGIDAEQYAAYDSDLGARQWPPQRWKITEDEQLELWPIPSQNFDPVGLDGQVKLTAIRKLQPLVDDGDRCDIDGHLLILFCSAENLAASGSKDASLKLQQANARYAKLTGRQRPRRKFNMFGIDNRERVKTVPIAVYNAPNP